MTLRELPATEWASLAGTDLGNVLPLLTADQTRVAVVEHEGMIVGCWALTSFLHAEGIWIHPAYRQGVGVQRRLLRWLAQTARSLGVSAVITGALTDTIGAYAERLGGQRRDGATYVIPVDTMGYTPLSHKVRN